MTAGRHRGVPLTQHGFFLVESDGTTRNSRVSLGNSYRRWSAHFKSHDAAERIPHRTPFPLHARLVQGGVDRVRALHVPRRLQADHRRGRAPLRVVERACVQLVSPQLRETAPVRERHRCTRQSRRYLRSRGERRDGEDADRSAQRRLGTKRQGSRQGSREGGKGEGRGGGQGGGQGYQASREGGQGCRQTDREGGQGCRQTDREGRQGCRQTDREGGQGLPPNRPRRRPRLPPNRPRRRPRLP